MIRADAAAELTRHVHTLSEQETTEVVEALADLIVNFLTGPTRTRSLAGATGTKP